ncbi:GntR family transcriptional regulator [Pseudophaeobacter sp.]|uniref:FadR/GntR family transcriptional regulator n=1 Tax=Pseudophaeobacter sp. TaxID=1971739 RepID=UPI003296B2FB
MSRIASPLDPTGVKDLQETDEFTERLRQEILEGGLPRGDRLPPEREMAQRFGISRARLRQALDRLEAEGTVFRRRGQGTFVQPPPATDAARLKSLSARVSLQEVMEVRFEIEPALAGLAAQRADTRAGEVLAQAAQATLEAADQQSYDLADDIFHYKIAEMAQNPLFLTVYEAIRTVRAQANWAEKRAQTYAPETTRLLAQQHQVLLAAILKGEAVAAKAAMKAHLTFVADALLQNLPD